MRLLPCPSDQCRAQGALLPPNDAYPNGEPYLTGQYVDRYYCYRCKSNVTLTTAEYHSRKVLTLGDYERLAKEYGNPKLAELPTRDLVAAGIPAKLKTRTGHVSPAADLFAAGVQSADDVEELARKE